MQEYPKMLYLAGDGGELIVESAEAEKLARSDGYVSHHELPAAASETTTELPAEIAAMGLDDLKAYAKDHFGLSYTKIKMETLQAKVAAKIAGAKAEAVAAAKAQTPPQGEPAVAGANDPTPAA